MEPNYGYADGFCAPETTKSACDVKPLQGIGSIADEAERTAELISSFIARFRHGDMPSAGTAQTLKPVPSGHHGQIERLRDAVAEVNKLARDLGTIG